MRPQHEVLEGLPTLPAARRLSSRLPGWGAARKGTPTPYLPALPSARPEPSSEHMLAHGRIPTTSLGGGRAHTRGPRQNVNTLPFREHAAEGQPPSPLGRKLRSLICTQC